MAFAQGQASGWVKALEGRNGLKITKLSDPNFLRTLENCIRIGAAALAPAPVLAEHFSLSQMQQQSASAILIDSPAEHHRGGTLQYVTV